MWMGNQVKQNWEHVLFKLNRFILTQTKKTSLYEFVSLNINTLLYENYYPFVMHYMYKSFLISILAVYVIICPTIYICDFRIDNYIITNIPLYLLIIF